MPVCAYVHLFALKRNRVKLTDACLPVSSLC